MGRKANTLFAGVIFWSLQLPATGLANDFPTEARVEYVAACMSGDGEKSPRMRQCACAIDVIATELPYDTYVAAETILRMRKMNGEKGSLFRETDSLRDSVGSLRSAETTAKANCF